MAQTIYHAATSRGKTDLGWLKSAHTFSFGGYYYPERISFGALRVLNDDLVAGGGGFGRHPHDNMEIISIPLKGSLKHIDNLGNTAVISEGDIQVMSAGTGLFHEEYNESPDETVAFLQIWIYPNIRNVEPRYDLVKLNKADRHNRLQQILSPAKDDTGAWIYQDAWSHLGDFDKRCDVCYQVKRANNGIYVFVLSGSLKIAGWNLASRDGLGIWDIDHITIEVQENAEFLLMEVPMNL